MLGGGKSVSDETSCVSHLQTLTTPARETPGRKLPAPRDPQDSHPGLGLPAQPSMQAAGWGWAVGPNQRLISRSEGLFVALPPPLLAGLKSAASPDLAVGEAALAEVWVRWSSDCQGPPVHRAAPSLLKASQAWVARGEQGRKGEQKMSPAHLSGSHAISPWPPCP